MLEAAGNYRRTDRERHDQQLAWERGDKAFFAAGACHVLAWVCRDVHSGRGLRLAAIRNIGETQVWHTFAVWGEMVFDASGWHRLDDVVAVNEAFEGRRLEAIDIDVGLDEFCTLHHHRPPERYWGDPVPRAEAYVRRFRPPWTGAETPATS